MSRADRSITTVVPWYGGNRRLAHEVGAELSGCAWVGVPFAGGMPELLHLRASTILVSDLHRHVINLARVLQDERLGPRLVRELRRECFHADTLAAAQADAAAADLVAGGPPDYAAAKAYFISQWMGRSGRGGSATEFRGKLPVRWNAAGGDSCRRYRTAVESILAWRRVMQRCNFVVLDVFEFLGNVKDVAGHGLYLDPPFPGVGDDYAFRFSADKHRELAHALGRFAQVKIVCRFYDAPLIRELYWTEPTEQSSSAWRWRHLQGGVDQHNQTKPEVLLIRNEVPDGKVA